MVYESDPAVTAWFEHAVTHPNPSVRAAALSLLGRVDCAPRRTLIAAGLVDEDPAVRAAAAWSEAMHALEADQGATDLFESELDPRPDALDLGWEWQYRVVVCHGMYVPSYAVVVWTEHEDDVAAKRLALLKGTGGKEPLEEVPVIVERSLVTRYTRAAKSASEARRWASTGRPRYEDV